LKMLACCVKMLACCVKISMYALQRQPDGCACTHPSVHEHILLFELRIALVLQVHRVHECPGVTTSHCHHVQPEAVCIPGAATMCAYRGGQQCM
jgi:hypothetical protein